MQLVQFFVPGVGRRVGVISGSDVTDLTAAAPDCPGVVQLAARAFRSGQRLADLVDNLVRGSSSARFSYAQLLAAFPDGSAAYLLPPVDHPEPSRLQITGTGLTHLGSVESRDQMHGGQAADVPQTDSARMFAMGREGGRPAAGQRGAAPEWFYKGNGTNLRGHRARLEIPAFALDGGEEPEIVGCYLIDPAGRPRRLGFVLGNEWSDHATEKINYLYLAPSKLRMCAMGPSLQVTDQFDEVPLQCIVTRSGQVLYDSGTLYSGERHMCHSLRNLEDHHFKYSQHRQPGDLHLHFFGTSKLSFGSRNWKYQPGDEIRIAAPGFSESLVNTVSAGPEEEGRPLQVEPA